MERKVGGAFDVAQRADRSDFRAVELIRRTRRALRCIFAATSLVICLGLVGCGTNKFQKELQTEEAAIKLTKETIAGEYRLISTKELKTLLGGDEDFVLVDTMPTAASFNKGHIAGAVNFVFPKEIIDTWDESSMGKSTQEQYEALLGEEKDRKIIIYCGFVKCPRSHNGAVFARQMGYTNVYRYPGGIDAWRGAGNPLVTTK